MNCIASMVKYILYIFNLVFVLCGIFLIVMGSIILSKMGDFKSFDEVIHTQTIPILIIVLGCIIFLISFSGCCGAIRENSCCMMIYAICMFIVVCLQIALVVWIFVERQSFLNTMSDVVHDAWKQNDQTHGYPMDALQLSFECCGVQGYNDYLLNNQQVPNSCCGSLNKACPAEVYQTRPGCEGKFVDFWSSNMAIIRWVGIAIALVEVVALTFACCLVTSIKKSRGHNL